MASATPSKRWKLTAPYCDSSKFQNSGLHKYLDASDYLEKLCECSYCREYQTKYQVEQTAYQELYPYGLDSTSNSNEDIPRSPVIVLFVHFVKFVQFLNLVGLGDGLRSVSYYLSGEGLEEMAPASNEEQFKFLISCIRHSNNGKVDFSEVADECNIVTKGAAAKRYERLMKFHGIHQSQSGSSTASIIRDAFVAFPRRKASSPPHPQQNKKKRKLDNYAETGSNFNTDDDEGLENVKAESSSPVKSEVIKAEHVKDEPTGQEMMPDSTNSTDSAASTQAIQHSYDGAMGFNGVHDSAMFDDFLRFGGSFQPGQEFPAALSVNQSEGEVASLGTTPAIGSGDGHGIHESILITD